MAEGPYQRSAEHGSRTSVVPVMRLLLAASLLLVSCFPTTHIDYIDFVKANGITYVGVNYFGGGPGVGRAPVEADLGPEHFRVKQMLSDGSKGPEYRTVDGDSAFVPAGEPVYSLKGYATTFRLAARREGKLVLYEADSNPAAKTGRDLLDIEGKVVGIALVSGKDGRTILGRITERSRIDDLVRLVLSAPVDQDPPQPSSSPRTPLPMPTTPLERPDYGFYVAFQLVDGSATQRHYDIANGVLHRGIFAGGAFRSAVQELAAAAPTPTPVPATINLTRTYDLARAVRVSIKAPPSGPSQDAELLAKLAAALDTDLPATRSTVRGADGPVVIFEFADHYVSLAYDPAADLLRVVVPDDELAVRPNAEFRALLNASR
jgi:hypothetical protein